MFHFQMFLCFDHHNQFKESELISQIFKEHIKPQGLNNCRPSQRKDAHEIAETIPVKTIRVNTDINLYRLRR